MMTMAAAAVTALPIGQDGGHGYKRGEGEAERRGGEDFAHGHLWLLSDPVGRRILGAILAIVAERGMAGAFIWRSTRTPLFQGRASFGAASLLFKEIELH
jgi:hypothetical protein